jgi:hypothetical protein
MRFLTVAALGIALATPALAQDTAPLDTRMCPDGAATMPDGSPCPPIATQQGGSDPSPGQVPGSGGNASRNNNNTGGSTAPSGTTGGSDPLSPGSGAAGSTVPGSSPN